MSANSIDERLGRLQREHRPQGAAPSRRLVDMVVEGSAPQPRSAGAALAGALLGSLAGAGLKLYALPGVAVAGEAAVFATPLAAAAWLAFSSSLAVAGYAALRHRSHPRLLQFSAINLLMIVVLLLA